MENFLHYNCLSQDMAKSKSNIYNVNFITILIVVFFHFMSVYLLLPIMPLYLISHLGATTTEMAVILSGFTVAAFIICPIAGYLVDNLKRKPTLIILNIVFIAVSSIYLFVDNLWGFGVNRIMNGAIYGMITVFGFTMTVNSVKAQFKDKSMLYYGIASKLGMAIAPGIAIVMFLNDYGFRNIFITSMIFSSAGLFSILFINQKNQRKMEVHTKSTFDKHIFIKVIPETIALSMITFTYGIINNYMSTMGIKNRHYALESIIFFALFALGMVISKLIIRTRIKRKDYVIIVLFCAISIVLSIIAIGLWEQEIILYIAALVTGACFETITVIFRRMFIDMSPSDRIGTGSSNYYMSWDLGMGAGVVIGGILSHHESFLQIFIICSVLIVIGALLFKFFVYNHYLKNIDVSNR